MVHNISCVGIESRVVGTLGSFPWEAVMVTIVFVQGFPLIDTFDGACRENISTYYVYDEYSTVKHN